MKVKDSVPGKLKGHPKIHKKGYPMETIVSVVQHPMEGIAETAENELKTHVKQLPSYTRDTAHFLRELNQLTNHYYPIYVLLFTMDVKGLYANVPRRDARKAYDKPLKNRPNKSFLTSGVLVKQEPPCQ